MGYSLGNDIMLFGKELPESEIINQIEEQFRNEFKPYELKEYFRVSITNIVEGIATSTTNPTIPKDVTYFLECLSECGLSAPVVDEIRKMLPLIHFVDSFSSELQ